MFCLCSGCDGYGASCLICDSCSLRCCGVVVFLFRCVCDVYVCPACMSFMF